MKESNWIVWFCRVCLCLKRLLNQDQYIYAFRLIVNGVWQMNYTNSYRWKEKKHSSTRNFTSFLCFLYGVIETVVIITFGCSYRMVFSLVAGIEYWCCYIFIYLFFFSGIVVLIPTKLLLPLLLSMEFTMLLLFLFCILTSSNLYTFRWRH